MEAAALVAKAHLAGAKRPEVLSRPGHIIWTHRRRQFRTLTSQKALPKVWSPKARAPMQRWQLWLRHAAHGTSYIPPESTPPPARPRTSVQPNHNAACTNEHDYVQSFLALSEETSADGSARQEERGCWPLLPLHDLLPGVGNQARTCGLTPNLHVKVDLLRDRALSLSGHGTHHQGGGPGSGQAGALQG